MKKEEKKHPLLVTRFDRLTESKQVKSVPQFLRKRFVNVQEYDEKLKTVVTKSQFKTVNRKEEMQNYRVSDFSIQNQVSAGVSLNTVKLSPSRFAFLDSVPTKSNNE